MRNLSVVIPSYNEQENIEKTIVSFFNKLKDEKIPHELFVVNDNSTDGTLCILKQMKHSIPTLKFITNSGPNGYGYAVRKGLDSFNGDCICVVMADLSDDPDDLVTFYRTMEKYNCDMVFGSRWMKGAKVINYPKQKFLLNRFVNNLIRFIFGFKYNDVTNGFKLFSKKTITGVKPFLSGQFSLALEIPLRAIIRGYSYRVVPTNWYNREVGQSNLRLIKMGPKYLYIFLICFVEHISLKFGPTTEQ